ncbi:MAG: hypothetical protein OER95_01545 [Acidimicrobiia bacterium]|nr:hypothetical protein [Acidimicrobiia bacterium]
MFTWGSKYLFGVCLAAFIGALAYGLITGGEPVGVISLGYKGGVGEHVGYTLLISAGFAALLLGVVGVVTRDGDAEDMSQLVGSERTLSVRPPIGLSIASPLTAFGVACLALGLAVSQAFLYLGIVVLAIVGIEWTVQAWSDRATGDDEINDVIRRRILAPFEVPMLGLLAIAVVVIGLSRILLAVSEAGSVVIATITAAFIFLSAILITKSRAPRAIISAIVTFGAVAVLAGGIVGAVIGERDFHHGGGGHSDGAVVEEGE